MWGTGAVLLLLFLPATDFEADGLKALDAKQYDQAAQLFAQAIQADPKDYAAHFQLALAKSLLGKDAEAVTEYQKTLALKPGLYQAELNLGILLVRAKRAGEAVPLLNAAVQAKPKEFRTQWHLAEALLASGDAVQAEAHYQAAAELDPKSGAAELGLARAQAKQNRLADAAGHFQKAAVLDPNFNDALLELAGLYEQNQQPEEAISLYQKFPGNVAAEERLGELLIEAKRYADAIPYLEKATAHDPTPANRLALATAYQMNHDSEKGLAQLAQAVAAEPGSFALHMRYGRELRDARQFMPAANQFAAATKLKPDSKEAWNELAAMLNSAEQYPQALAALDRVRALGGEVPGDYFLRAIILDRLHDYKPALEAYQKFLQTSGGKNPNQEFQARHRMITIEHILSKR
jgi:tetratricopeptide (TPR) repeat protein